MATARTAASRAFASVLCPVDFSEHARHALRLGARVARTTGARLTVLYVTDPLLAAAAAAAYDEKAMSRQTDAELHQFLASAAGPEPFSPRARFEVVEGSPAEQIVDAAARHGCDLIVMSTQGVTGARRLFFGSTTEGVLKHSTIPVLVVPTR